MTQPVNRPVAIIGMGCRWPGGVADVEGFRKLLMQGRDAVGDIPADRIDVAHYYDPRPAVSGRMMTRKGGFIEGIWDFDAAFFGISPREAERMDPQQRLLMETVWEAIEDAGVDARTLEGSRTGVFIGQWTSDFEGRLFAEPEGVDFQMTTGSGRYADLWPYLILSGLARAIVDHRHRLLVIARGSAPRGAKHPDRGCRACARRRDQPDPATAHHHSLFAKRHDGARRPLQVR